MHWPFTGGRYRLGPFTEGGVPARAIYRGELPAKAWSSRAPARTHGRHHGEHGDEAHVVVPGRSDLRGKHHIFKCNVFCKCMCGINLIHVHSFSILDMCLQSIQ